MHIGTQPNPFDRMLSEIRTGLSGPTAAGGQAGDSSSLSELRARLDRLVRKAAADYANLDQSDKALHSKVKLLEEQLEQLIVNRHAAGQGNFEVEITDRGWDGKPSKYTATPTDGKGPVTEITLVRGYGGAPSKYLVTRHGRDPTSSI